MITKLVAILINNRIPIILYIYTYIYTHPHTYNYIMYIDLRDTNDAYFKLANCCIMYGLFSKVMDPKYFAMNNTFSVHFFIRFI